MIIGELKITKSSRQAVPFGPPRPLRPPFRPPSFGLQLNSRPSLSQTGRGAAYNVDAMSLDDYKVVLYRNQPDGWVAEIPAIQGCYALMPTREEALAELASVFEVIAAEYWEKGLPLPADSTAIVNA